MTITKPKIILFRGMPGVGKTFISDKVAEKLSIAIIRKDDIYDSIYIDVSTHSLRNKISYDLIYKLIDTNLKARIDLIIDCPFREHKDLYILSNFVKNRDGILKTILCECSDEELWARRFNKRANNPNHNNLLTDFNLLRSHYQSLKLEKYDNELVLDTQQNIEHLLPRILSYL